MSYDHEDREVRARPKARAENFTRLITLPGGQVILRPEQPGMQAVRSGSKPSAFPKPVMRDLRRSTVKDGWTIGVGKVESKR
jgi:hypothetical protein